MDISQLIGYIAAASTTVAFLPQTLKIIKSKNTKDISLFMYVIFVFGIACWLIFGIMTHCLPIILANVVSFILSFTILMLKLKYK